MRAVNLAKVAAEAEILRIRHILQRQPIRAAVGLAAVIFALGALGLALVAGWQVLRLYVPPISRGWFLRSAVAWERAGATISAPFAGVHIVEATKQVYRAIPARREKRQLVPGLAPVLEPVLTPSTGPFGRRHRATWQEAAQLPLCLLSPNMQNRRIIDRIIREAGGPAARPRMPGLSLGIGLTRWMESR